MLNLLGLHFFIWYPKQDAPNLNRAPQMKEFGPKFAFDINVFRSILAGMLMGARVYITESTCMQYTLVRGLLQCATVTAAVRHSNCCSAPQ